MTARRQILLTHLKEHGNSPNAEKQIAALRAAVAPLGWAIVVRRRTARTSPSNTLRAVIENWPVGDGAVVTAADLVERAGANSKWRTALLGWCPPRGDAELPTARSVGCKLRGAYGVTVAGYVIESAFRDGEGRSWLRRLASPNP